MSVKVYIDGQEGTTGLKILERFEGRNDIEIIRISEEKRKDSAERARLINSADYVFLCLPDEASREAVSFVDNDHVRIIDASTAHRTNPDWAYGFPELSAEHREKITKSNRVAVPGCYASGFASIVYPLVNNGIIPADFPVFASGRRNLINIEKYTSVTYNIIGEIMYVMNRHIIAYVARDDTAVGDAYRNSEVVIFEHLSFYPTDSYQSEETVTFHHLRIKLISHQNIIPVSSDVFIVH